MDKFVIDAYAWIEYFNGTSLGEKVKKIVEDSDNEIYTNILTIAELSSSYKRNSLNFDDEKKIILSLSNIFNVNLEFCDIVGKLHASIKRERKHIGLVDVFILLTAKELNAKVVTGDEDFRGMKEVIMLK